MFGSRFNVFHFETQPSYPNIVECLVRLARRGWFEKLDDVEERHRMVPGNLHEDRPEPTVDLQPETPPDPRAFLENLVGELLESEHLIEWHGPVHVPYIYIRVHHLPNLDFSH